MTDDWVSLALHCVVGALYSPEESCQWSQQMPGPTDSPGRTPNAVAFTRFPHPVWMVIGLRKQASLYLVPTDQEFRADVPFKPTLCSDYEMALRAHI